MVTITGKVNLKFRDKDGNILFEYENHNLITATGLEQMCRRLGGNSWDKIDAMGLGDSNQAPAQGDDDIVGNFIAGDNSCINTFVSPNIARIVGQITLTNKSGEVIREVACADVVPTGAIPPPIFARALVSPTITIPSNSEFVDILWEFEFT